MQKLKKILIWLVGIILVVLIGISAYVHFSTYQPSVNAKISAKSATHTKNVTVFKAKKNKMTVIFYSGALVAPDSYSVWAKKVAESGYTVKIVHFPFNMAFLNMNAAKSLVKPNEKYVIGGHSLGGAMAARYAHNNSSKNLKGVFLLGAYADYKGRLDRSDLKVLSITATHDGVLNWKNYNSDKKYLPADTEFKSIKGGNHGGFGSYGTQKGDKKATISNQKQQDIIANLLVSWMNKVQ